jgi:hypothetical protein
MFEAAQFEPPGGDGARVEFQFGRHGRRRDGGLPSRRRSRREPEPESATDRAR